MAVVLDDKQRLAVDQMKNGCILCGGVGSGKSRTALSYFYEKVCNCMATPIDLYIITPAKKRDSGEWEDEIRMFSFGDINITIDSWNNIAKYLNVCGAFFMFDEQRVVGYGKWSKSFIQITKKNKWVMLSATPGDTWSDYIPVFIANGFYKNKSDFANKHIVYSRFTKYPKVEKYLNMGKLINLRQSILVNIDYVREVKRHHITVISDYDKGLYKNIIRTRWNPYKDEPIQDASGLCYTLRCLVNSELDRIRVVKEIIEKHPTVIIFYNFDYELEILRDLGKELEIETAEWNGHKHQPLPKSSNWIYLVQYTAGAEGWNCITSNAMIFYSQNYSYKIMVQSAGRIDRRNSPYSDLYYYHVRSNSSIDIAIARALNRKKNFNEKGFTA